MAFCDAQHLQAVFTACPALHTLRLSSCAYLEDDALMPLLPACTPPADCTVPLDIWVGAATSLHCWEGAAHPQLSITES